MLRPVLLALLLLPLTFGGAIQASELGAFNQATDAAYRHYRGAAFYLRTGNPAVAGFELQDAIQAWNAQVMVFRDSPPDAFADDPQWTATLDEIAERLSAAESAAAAGETERARDALQPVRGLLSDLRRRNQVRVFSDCIDEANAAMDRLWHFRHNPPDFAKADQVNRLRADTAVMTFLYEQCRDQAPPAIAEDAGFQRIMEGTLYSLGRMWIRIDEQNTEAVINILREIRSFDRMLWLQFG